MTITWRPTRSSQSIGESLRKSRPGWCWRKSVAPPKGGRSSWRSLRPPRTTPISDATKTSPEGLRWPKAPQRRRPGRWRGKGRRWFGSTAGCTRRRFWARISSWSGCTRWSARVTRRLCGFSTMSFSSPCTPIRTAWSWCQTGTCATPYRKRDPPRASLASIRSM